MLRLIYVQRFRSKLRTLSSHPYNWHIFIFRHHQQLSIKCNLEVKKISMLTAKRVFYKKNDTYIPSSGASQLGEYRSMLPLHDRSDAQLNILFLLLTSICCFLKQNTIGNTVITLCIDVSMFFDRLYSDHDKTKVRLRQK